MIGEVLQAAAKAAADRGRKASIHNLDGLGEHRIIVEHVLEGDPREAKPWAECSRDIKLASLDVLPTLIKKLLEKVSKQVADVDAKLSALESMVLPDTGTKKPASRRRKG